MQSKISFVYDEMMQLKSQTEKASKLAKQALKTATTSQNTAEEAIELTAETNLKVANMERRLKALESNHIDFSTQSDKTNSHIHDIKTRLTTNSKMITSMAHNINNINTLIEKTSRDNATHISQNISQENLD